MQLRGNMKLNNLEINTRFPWFVVWNNNKKGIYINFNTNFHIAKSKISGVKRFDVNFQVLGFGISIHYCDWKENG